MQSNSSTLKIPSLDNQRADSVAPSKTPQEIFEELNAVAEEIEKCRLRNS